MKDALLIAVTVAALGCASVGVAIYVREPAIDEGKLAAAIAEETVSRQRAALEAERAEMQARSCRLWGVADTDLCAGGK